MDACTAGNESLPALCLRIQRLEPNLPLRAALDAPGSNNACRGGHCFPLLHVLGAYHSFLEGTLGSGVGAHGAQPNGLLSGHSMVDMQHRCHNEFDGGSTFEPKGGGAAFHPPVGATEWVDEIEEQKDAMRMAARAAKAAKGGEEDD